MRAKPRDQLMNKRLVTKWLVVVGEGVSQGLEAVIVSRGRHVTLLEAVELGLELNCAGFLVVAEEIADRLTHRVGPRFVLHDHIHEVVGERGVDPRGW